MTTFPKVMNNVTTTLRSDHVVGDGVLQVAVGTGPYFGTIFPIRVTCQRASDNSVVIFSVSGRSGDDLTVSTIEATPDLPLVTGDLCEMRLTAGAITELQDGLLYTTSAPTTGTVGGVPAGSTFTSTLVKDVVDQILHAYLAPAFTSFAITGAAPQEVGQVFSGAKTFTWSTSNSPNVAANTIAITDVTGSTTLGSGLANDGSENFSLNVTHNAPASHQWSIAAQNTHASPFSTTTSLSWQWRLYYGTNVNPTLNPATIKALTSSALASGFAGTYAYAGGGYKYLCFPDSFGGPTAFKDAATQLNVAMCDASDDPSYSNVHNGFNYAVVSVTNNFTVTTNYRVYRTKNVLGGTISIIVS